MLSRGTGAGLITGETKVQQTWRLEKGESKDGELRRDYVTPVEDASINDAFSWRKMRAVLAAHQGKHASIASALLSQRKMLLLLVCWKVSGCITVAAKCCCLDIAS